jgi:CheY-like chemotaxis protein
VPTQHVPPPATIPAAASRVPSSSRLGAAARATGATQPTVLVIDDSADSRLLIGHFAEDAGCQAIMAVSGEQGLQMALEFHPDLITLDLAMPGMDGFDVLRRLKMHPRTAEIPVIVVSIIASEKRGMIVGAVDVVDKPIRRDELVGAMQRNIGVGRARVLVVEDDADTRALIEAHLRDFPAVDVAAATDGASALALLENFSPDLVILDLSMPRIGGIEFLQQFRADERFVHVPVVVATGKSLTDDERRELQRETLALLPKGAEFGERLQRTMRGALRDLRSVTRELV